MTLRSDASLSGHTSPASNRTGCGLVASTLCVSSLAVMVPRAWLLYLQQVVDELVDLGIGEVRRVGMRRSIEHFVERRCLAIV